MRIVIPFMPFLPHRFTLPVALLLLTPLCTSNSMAAPCGTPAGKVLDTSLHALGGRELLEGIDAIELRANVARNLLEQSIRPEGPWIQDMYQLQLALDFRHERMHGIEQRTSRLGWLAPPERPPAPVEYIVANGIAASRSGDKLVPTRQSLVQDMQELLAFNPLQALLTAARAPNACLEGKDVLHGTEQDVVAWTWHNTKVRMLIDRNTHLPSEVTWSGPRPRDIFWNAWGDVDTRLRFENWSLRPNGLRVPSQWSYLRNGLPDQTWELGTLELTARPDAATWDLPGTLRGDIARLPADVDSIPLGSSQSPPVEIAPGVVRIPGRWDVTLVRQHDGIVVIEAPMGNGYSIRVLQEAAVRFPGLPVKAVVTTSDAWPHIAGLREYAARGIPIYALDLNVAIVERLLRAPHASRPDSLQRAPRDARLHPVGARTAIDSRENRIELIPLRTAVGERQMLAWLPTNRIVYTSDLVQPSGPKEWFAPEMLLELRQRFEAEDIAPLHAYGMHYAPAAWNEMTDWLDAYHAPRHETVAAP